MSSKRSISSKGGFSGSSTFPALRRADLRRPEKPARESDAPNPVSEYGKSKLAGELEVRSACKSEHVILRPPAVYGPRDTEFLPLFKAVKAHILPRLGSSRLALSFVFVKDLAEAVAILPDPSRRPRQNTLRRFT